MHRAVLHLIVLARTAGHHDDVRTEHVGQPGLCGNYQAAFLVPDGPGAFGDEGHLGARKPAEHLVGPIASRQVNRSNSRMAICIDSP